MSDATTETTATVEMSPEIGELAAALSALQGELPAVPKSKTANAGSYAYDYADLADCMAAAAPLLAKHKLAVSQVIVGKRLYTMLTHGSGQWLRGYQDLAPTKNDPQAFGSAVTYARRYGLAILGLVTEADDDGQTASQPASQPAPKQKRQPATPQEPAPETPPPDDIPPPADSGDAERKRRISEMDRGKLNAVVHKFCDHDLLHAHVLGKQKESLTDLSLTEFRQLALHMLDGALAPSDETGELIWTWALKPIEKRAACPHCKKE